MRHNAIPQIIHLVTPTILLSMDQNIVQATETKNDQQEIRMSKEDKQFLIVLQANRMVLIRNIIPCTDLLDKLTQLNVFPSSMIKEIQVTN